MKTIAATLCSFLFALPLLAQHDAQTLHFRRLDNGGLVRVPWSRLDPAQSDELLLEEV